MRTSRFLAVCPWQKAAFKKTAFPFSFQIKYVTVGSTVHQLHGFELGLYRPVWSVMILAQGVGGCTWVGQVGYVFRSVQGSLEPQLLTPTSHRV